MRLVQLQKGNLRRVALVEEPNLRLVDCESVYALANAALAERIKLDDAAERRATRVTLPYDSVYECKSEWRLLPPADHPSEPARCLISGTGLTHLGSASDRQRMHALREDELTDSMKIFRWGLEGGRPRSGEIGIAPEWFYKGNGTILRAHGEPLEFPPYADDGGEEAEIAGIYLIGPDARPYRVGLAIGNEFSDHEFEKKNYLNLAGSKLRTCSIGPELVIDPEFQSVTVNATIERDGKELWTKSFPSGEAEMCHSLQNIEHHHFKFEAHRRPGDVHIHFFGTACLSFRDGVRLRSGDVMRVSCNGFGRPLRNPVHIADSRMSLISVASIG
ncbi:MAG TPA: AraD1 family protein [Candidatus Acidoferrales bacterium]|nr:AraD1 family protein [Candidatus Acidoferrales bacterium]